MKKLIILTLFLCLLLTACAQVPASEGPEIAATTYPVAQFAEAVCAGTDITVSRIVNDSVSCLHDYSLSVSQMKILERADLVILSGVGLEDFMDDALALCPDVVDASVGIPLLETDGEAHDEHQHDGHDHGEHDPHIWLSPENAQIMVQNIADALTARYPDYAGQFAENASAYQAQLQELQAYGEAALSDLSSRSLVTFHDGFSYFAQAFDLTILKAIEEESGSEASARELTEIVTLMREHALAAIFTETNGATAAAQIVSRETGCSVYALDMAMGDTPYFEAMYHNIDVIAEAYE